MSHSAMKQLTYTVDLNESTRKVYLDGVYVTDDHEGHQFNLRLYRGSDPVQLPSGVAVHGYFIRYSDNTTLTLEKGTASGNVASIKLDKLCYALPGQFALVIKVMEGEAISAIFHAEGSMVISKTDKVIDAGNVIPSLDELLAKIADIEDATSDGRAAAQEARDAGTQAVAIAQDAAGEALAAAQTVQSIYEVKADAIMDESARAASHVIYPQDGPLAVTLYGQTTEMGTGDKSPDNPYTISGTGLIHVRLDGTEAWNMSSLSVNGYKSYLVTVIEVRNKEDNKAFCDCFRSGTYQEWTGLVADEFVQSASRTIGFRVNESTAPDVSAWKAYLNANPLNVWCSAYSDDYIDSAAVACDTDNGHEAIGMYLLPDGAPLMGNGTVDDTVENWVLSGCDKRVVLDGSESWAFWDKFSYLKLTDCVGNTAFCDRFFNASASTYTGAIDINQNTKELRINSGHTSAADFKAYLAANPLTVYYRSTAYMPDKDLRVCKAVRRYAKIYAKDMAWTRYVDNTTNNVCFYTPVKNYKTTRSKIISEHFEYFNGTAGTPIGDVAWGSNTPNGNIIAAYSTSATIEDWNAFLDAQEAAGKPVWFAYELATPETYMTDPLYLRKPYGMEAVTVTGSGETAVTYPHDTKHYIDSKISELVTLALANQ